MGAGPVVRLSPLHEGHGHPGSDPGSDHGSDHGGGTDVPVPGAAGHPVYSDRMGNNDVFAVIADKTRRGILTALKDGERPVGDLVAELGVSQPTVSKHLKILREAGMVSMEAQGQRRLYAVQPEPLAEVTAWIHEIADGAAPVPPALPDPGTEDVVATEHGTVVPDGAGTAAGTAAVPDPDTVVPPQPLEPRPERPAGGTTPRPGRGTGNRAADILSSLSGLRRRRRPPRR